MVSPSPSLTPPPADPPGGRPSSGDNPDPGGDRLRRRDWALAALVALLATLLCVLLAERRGFWLDEYYTLQAARMSFRQMVEDRLGAGHSPVYFFYARLGFPWGDGLRALRLGSALALGATVLLLTGLAGAMRLRRSLPALWALCLVQPYWITAGTEYRYMMPVIALTAATAWAAYLYSERWAALLGLLLAALLGLLLWVHGSAQFVAAGLLIFLCWESLRRGGERLGWVLLRLWPVLAGLLASAPLLYLLRHHQAASKLPRLVHLEELLKSLNEVVFQAHELWLDWLNARPLDNIFLLPMLLLLGASIALTRRRLLAGGRARAWRLLGGLMIGIPLAQGLITLLVRQVQGPARYVAAFSVPATLCLALAWDAPPARPGLRRLFRGGLAGLLLLQALGAALDRGDLHREAIQWVLANLHGGKVLVSSRHINTFAFDYLARRPVPEVASLDESESVSNDTVRATIRKIFARQRRGFIFLYHDPLNLQARLADLLHDGFFLRSRVFAISGEVRVIAVIRNAAEQGWLAGLPPFKRPWGPARGDITDAFLEHEKSPKPTPAQDR